jgi:hypothetical protein
MNRKILILREESNVQDTFRLRQDYDGTGRMTDFPSGRNTKCVPRGALGRGRPFNWP